MPGSEGGEKLGALLTGQEGADWDEARSVYVGTLAEHFPAPAGVSFSAVDMGGIPGTLATPEQVEPDRIL